MREATEREAAIAKENVRLASETKEALERESATAEILRAISDSPTDVQPVFEAIASNAVRYCNAEDALVLLVESGLFIRKAHAGPVPSRGDGAQASPADRRTVAGHAFIEGRTIQVADMKNDPDHPLGRKIAAQTGHRTTLGAPLLRQGKPIGVILMRRTTVQPFMPHQIQLVETFADQAVIAIENVRLFNETKEALERQTAIGEILRAIAGSPTDIHPVLEAITASAIRFCAAEDALVMLPDGPGLRLAAHTGPVPIPDSLSYPLDGSSMSATAFATGRVLHIGDLQAEVASFPAGAANARASGYHTVLVAPLLREGTAIGTIGLRRSDARPFTDRQIDLLRTFADQAVIAIENVRLFNETKEALERQTATSEVLKVISTTTTDLAPVLQKLVETAAHLLGSDSSLIFKAEGEKLVVVAAHQPVQTILGTEVDLSGYGAAPQAFRTRSTVHIPDISKDPAYVGADQIRGPLSRLAVPIITSAGVFGVITCRYAEPRPFSPRQIELIENFAAQAAIAIENTRLFDETKDALDRQTALAEILRVISASPSDITPVLDAIAESAARFCTAENVTVIIKDDDGVLSPRAHVGPLSGEVRPWAVDQTTVTGRSIAEARTIQVPDLQAAGDEYPLGQSQAVALGYHTTMAAPLIRDGRGIGALLLRRAEVRPFTDKQVELVKVFADQAVIAIENVRLVSETKEALEQQTALAEILQVISRSPTDVQPVLDAIAENAARVCGASDAHVYRVSSDRLRQAAHVGPIPGLEPDESLPLDRGSVIGRSIVDRLAIHIRDAASDLDPGEYSTSVQLQRRWGYRTTLAVPLLREGVAIGGIAIRRREVRPFTMKQIELLQTFAAQAVIAIENVRLFNETREKSGQLEVANQELAAASRHKSEFLANMSHELRTPLNAIIGFSDVLEQRLFGELNERQADYTQDIASSGRHLLDLVNEILDLSKVEAGRMELEPSEFALAETIHGALAFVRERAASHQIALTAAVSTDLGTVMADERKIRQVLLNLLSNAVKFTPDGGAIEVRARRTADEAEVSVADTGIGIAPEDQAKVFDEFRQVGKASDRSREGTGLGLTLAKKFIELHGGRIWVESDVGKGTTFTFAIPVGTVAAPA